MTARELRFDDRVVLVTGAGRGMGREHARQFAARGAKLIVSDVGAGIDGEGVDQSVAQDVVDEIRAAGGEATAYTEDLATEEGARGVVRCAIDAHGRIDTIVHNAGFGIGANPFERERLDSLEKLLSVNIRAAYAMVIEAWPVMQRQQYGRIVLIGSTAWYGSARSVAYAAAKASYIGFTRSLAEEGAEFGIKLNLVGPSGVSRMSEAMPDSEFSRWFRETMKTELVSPAVLLLGHEKCPVSGETFAVAGGRVARMVLAETPGHVDPKLTPESVLAQLPNIMSGKLTPYATYSDSAAALMKTFGFMPSERVGQLSRPPPTEE